MFYRILGWNHAAPGSKQTRVYLETKDEIVISASSKSFRWAVGKRIASVLRWAERKRLLWAAANSREGLDRKRGRGKLGTRGLSRPRSV